MLILILGSNLLGDMFYKNLSKLSLYNKVFELEFFESGSKQLCLQDSTSSNNTSYPWTDESVRDVYVNHKATDINDEVADIYQKYFDKYNEQHATDFNIENLDRLNDIPQELLDEISQDPDIVWIKSKGDRAIKRMEDNSKLEIIAGGGVSIENVNLLDPNSPLFEIASLERDLSIEKIYNKYIEQSKKGETISFGGNEVENPLFGVSNEEIRAEAEAEADKLLDVNGMGLLREGVATQFIDAYGSESAYDKLIDSYKAQIEAEIVEGQIIENLSLEQVYSIRREVFNETYPDEELGELSQNLAERSRGAGQLMRDAHDEKGEKVGGETSRRGKFIPDGNISYMIRDGENQITNIEHSKIRLEIYDKYLNESNELEAPEIEEEIDEYKIAKAKAKEITSDGIVTEQERDELFEMTEGFRTVDSKVRSAKGVIHEVEIIEKTGRERDKSFKVEGGEAVQDASAMNNEVPDEAMMAAMALSDSGVSVASGNVSSSPLNNINRTRDLS